MKKGLAFALAVIAVSASQVVCAQYLDRRSERDAGRNEISPSWQAGVNRSAGRDRFGTEAGASIGRDRSIDFTRSVSQRAPGDEMRPQGIPVGGFTAYPSLSVAEHRDSNVFGNEEDQDEDWITTVQPSLRLQSDWVRHSLILTARGTIGRYADYDSEDYEDYYVGANGRLDVLQASNLYGTLSFQRSHIGRSSPEDTGSAVTPKLYHRAAAYLGGAHGAGLVNASVDTSLTWTDFIDGKTAAGANINNDDDDNLVVSPGFRLGYSKVAGNEIYLRTRYVQTIYADPTQDGGADRDNWGVDVIVGATKNIANVWIGEVYVGFAPRYFDDATLDPIVGTTGVTGGLNVLWNPTAITSLIGNFTRTASATTTAGASAISTMSGRLTLEHEATRSFLFDTSVGYARDDYVGVARLDDTYRAGAGAEYRMNRWVSVDLGYDYIRRDSNTAGATYDRHEVGVGLSFKY